MINDISTELITEKVLESVLFDEETLEVNIGTGLITEELFDANLIDEDIISTEIEVSPDSGEHYPDYEGDYTVVPDKEKIILSSRNTVLRDDVIITSIPAYRVTNQYGTTFTIGV